MPTGIEYADETWNPVTGCSHAGSPGCDNCWAKRNANRMRGRFGYDPDDPFKVTEHFDKWGTPDSWKKPRMIFVCSMGDLFHEDVHSFDIGMALDAMIGNPRHTFLVLTKRPERMRDELAESHLWNSGRFPNQHIWLGVSAENQEWLDKRVPILLQIPAAIHYVSLEPLLGPVDLAKYLPELCAVHHQYQCGCERKPSLGWVIAGGETGPGARLMKAEWAHKVRDDCVERSVPFFFKQIGKRLAMRRKSVPFMVGHERRRLDGREWNEVPGRHNL